MESLPPTSPRSRARTALGWIARLAITGGVFAFLFTRIDAHAVAKSIERISAGALLGAVACLLFAIATALVRWRLLLLAYGAVALPPRIELLRLYWVSMFFNLLPGAVGGDVYRGYASRHYFTGAAATRSVSVVFVERVFGFTGLLILAAAATLIGPKADPQVLFYSALGLCAATGAVLAIIIGRRISHLLPGPLGKLTATLPAIERPLPFAVAIGLSVVTHVVVALAGHCIIRSIAPSVTLLDSMQIFPIGTLASYFPLTVAGAGARDGALVFLFAKLGIAREDALATSLCLLACNLVTAGIGGFMQARGKTPESVPAARTSL